MNYNLPFIPERTGKPRDHGLNMIMDKGLSLRQVEDMIESCSELIDLVKFGFGTSLLTNRLSDKIKLYKDANIKTYFGGTLFEAFLIRDMVDDYKKYVDSFQIEIIEISDGSMSIDHEQKLELIHALSNQYTVISEIGSKVKGLVIPPEKWVENMKSELDAGSWKVIGEARESGTIGIYNPDGSVNTHLIGSITEHVKMENIIWEAPNSKQQAWFVNNFGHNVNLGNIAPVDIIPLETLRRGLRGDTFFRFLPNELQYKKPQV